MILPQLLVIPLRAAVCSDRPTTLDVLLRILPPPMPDLEQKRPVLNVGFVIDRSGSMAGRNKIDYARRAVCYAIEQLLPSDRLSVTIFDDQVQTLIPSTPANNKASFTRLVQQIQPGNSTALHAGWVQGGIQVSQHLDAADLNRIILLSDGLANVGETNPDAIASDVYGLAKRGVSTSTLGVGDDYNEDLLEAMARSGDGNYYYIASAEQLPGIFECELQGLVATFGSAATLEMQPLGEVTVLDLLNDLSKAADGRWQLPNLLYENPLDLVVRLKIPALAAETALCNFVLAWVDAEQQQQRVTITLQLPVTHSDQLAAFPVNPEVQQQVALMMAARSKKEAVRLVDQGDFAAANQVLEETRQQILEFNVPMSAPEAAALEDLQQKLADRELLGYRKMASSQSYRRSMRHSSGHTSLLYAFARGPQLGDISQMQVDAIVNSTDQYLSDQGAISRAIHQAAGPELLAACHQLQGCQVGEAKITPGFGLPAKWVIHTVCPSWQGGHQGEIEQLKQCYRSCLDLAVRQGIHSIAFPALGTGARGFPLRQATLAAIEITSRFLLSNSQIGLIQLVCFDQQTLEEYQMQFERVLGW